MKYDYLVVGAGPFGSVFAHEAHKRGKSVLVIDRRNHIAGNLYCESRAYDRYFLDKCLACQCCGGPA